MRRFSTQRVLQIHCLGDDMSSRARVNLRVAEKAASRNSPIQEQFFRAAGERYARIAARCARLLELRS
ncbi:hypothetical protein HNP46_000285 [Pseudomonas nitritireducens]|uniref:Uncharacterized protein n=1 Tax=Pseudomonas nitroreducens TaxID=46680 RepID=A0A7W7KFP8_PSENT|nr:hypothetical protein [Pseudomonas nitritireducens]